MHSHLPPRLTGLKQRPFPHGEFCCLSGRQYYGLLRLLIRRPPGFRFLSLYQRLRQVRPADRMRPLLFQHLLSPHPALPTPEGSSRLLFQVLRRFPGLRFRLKNSAPSCSLSGPTFRRCKFHLMLRAVVSLPLLRELHRFSTSGRPEALDACYVAACPLPRPDFHRLVDVSFSGHTKRLLGGSYERKHFIPFTVYRPFRAEIYSLREPASLEYQKYQTCHPNNLVILTA